MADKLVAAGMALFIVYLLEVIDIGKEDAHADLTVHVLLIGVKGVAVEDPGHLVDETMMAQLINIVTVLEHQTINNVATFYGIKST